MTLRSRFLLYLALLHLLLTGLIVWKYESYGLWFFVLEGLLLVSLLTGLALTKALMAPINFITSGVDYLEETQFTTRFRETGQPELDHLIHAYNRMIENLRQEWLRLGEQRGILEALLQATPTAIVTFDFEDRMAMLNPAATNLFKAEAEALIGKRLADLEHPLAATLAELEPNRPRVVSYRGRRRLKCRRAHFVDRGFPRDFLLIEEVTEELRQSQTNAYEKLIRMMSHEVNNTIGATNSVLDSCLGYRDQLSADDRTDFVHAIQVVISRTEHLSGFMRELANIVRLPDPKPRPVDPIALLNDIERLMRAECSRRRIRWHQHLPEAMEPLPMDRHLMEQALLNIVKNGLEAIGEDGELEIRLVREPRRWTLTISDSGGALTPEVQGQLFSPFFTTKPNGQGLGLLLIQTVLLGHGFDFTLEGKAGETTRFTIHMPLNSTLSK